MAKRDEAFGGLRLNEYSFKKNLVKFFEDFSIWK